MSVVLSVLENLSLLAGAAALVFFIGLKWDLGSGDLRGRLLAGLVFGVAAALVILVPIEGPKGATFDTRAGPVLVAAFLYGPVAGALSAAIGAVARYEVGGAFQIGGALSPFFYLGAGLLFRRFWRRAEAGPFGFSLLALMGTVCVLPSFFIGTGWALGAEVVSQFWPVLLAGNLIGTLMLGLLMERLSLFGFQQRQTRAVLTNASDAILTLDGAGRVIEANPVAARILGRPPAELTGRPFETLFEPDRNGDAPGEDGDRAPQTASVLLADGKRRKLSYTISPFTIGDRRRSTVVIRDMTEILNARDELERMMGELAAQLQETAKANQSKSLFLANMSHELRTPLNAILGFTDLIRTVGPETLPRAKLHGYLADIHASGRVLLGLVDTVMDINRIERGDAVLSLETVNVNMLLGNVVRILALEADGGRTLRFAPSQKPAAIRCDPTALTQCMNNLVVNAFKHAGEGVGVEIATTLQEESVVVSVCDDGPGIPEEIRERLGEPFVRGDDALRRSLPGVGLGLALTKRLVEEQGGRLHVSRRETGGTRVTMAFPRVAAEPNTPPLRAAAE